MSKEKDGIPLLRGEKLLKFKNKINGILYYSTNNYSIQFRDGQEFLPVFQRPAPPRERQMLLIQKAALERV
jgi:hypothetical protein